MSERLFLGRPSGRRPDCPFGPSCLRLLGRPTNYMLFSWVEPWRRSWSSRDPRFMNPTGAPEPPGDLNRIVQGIFVLSAGVRERNRGCSPRAPGDSSRIVWGFFVLSAGEFLFRQWVWASAPAGVAPEPPGDSSRIV